MTTITLDTITAADTLLVQPVATQAVATVTTAQDRLANAMELLANALASDLSSDANKLKACTAFAQEILESAGDDVTKKRVVFHHSSRFNSFSKGEIDTLAEYGLSATNIPKKNLSLIVVKHKKELATSDGNEFIAWQAWDLEDGTAVRIAKPKADKKPDGLDMHTIIARWNAYNDLSRDQTAVLLRALGLVR